MMTHIFYLIGLWFFLYEVIWLYNINDRIEETNRFHELKALNKGKKYDEYPQEFKDIIRGNLLLMPVLLWVFVGLLSAQWVVFAAFITYSIITNHIGKIMGRRSLLYKVTHAINAVIGIAVSGFVIINHYHLHVNMTEWAKSLIA